MITIKKNPEKVSKLKVGTSAATPAEGEIIADRVTAANSGDTQSAELRNGELTLARGSSTPTYINFPNAGASLQLRGPSYATAVTIASNGAATFQKSDGAVVNLYRNDSEILDGNTFGRLQALSGDSNHTAGTEVGSIAFTAYGNQTGTRPRGQIRFQVANNASQAEAMRIEPDKKVTFYGGINLGDTTLSNYAEGTWTPTLPNGGTLTTNMKTYTRIGNLCTVHFYVSSIAPSATSSRFEIGGLPFTISNDANYYPAGTIGYCGDGDFHDAGIVGLTDANSVYFHVLDGASGWLSNNQVISRFSGSTDALICTLTYRVK